MSDKSKESQDLIGQLRRVIVAEGLVHRRVADKIGVTVTTFSRWMNEHTFPTSETHLKSIERFIKRHS